jgi:hypothetical protein
MCQLAFCSQMTEVREFSKLQRVQTLAMSFDES